MSVDSPLFSFFFYICTREKKYKKALYLHSSALFSFSTLRCAASTTPPRAEMRFEVRMRWLCRILALGFTGAQRPRATPSFFDGTQTAFDGLDVTQLQDVNR